MCLFHKWSKWKEYEESSYFTPGILSPKKIQGEIFERTEHRQKRDCQKCGKVEDVKIRD